MDLALSEFCDNSIEPPRQVPEVTLRIIKMEYYFSLYSCIFLLFFHVVSSLAILSKGKHLFIGQAGTDVICRSYCIWIQLSDCQFCRRNHFPYMIKTCTIMSFLNILKFLWHDLLNFSKDVLKCRKG